MKHNVLIDVDAIFDTRLGVISLFDEELAVEIMNNGWRERYADDITIFTDAISKDAYQRMYQNRNKEVLKRSRLTSFIFELGDTINHLEEMIKTDYGIIKESTIYLNLFPYIDLTDEEQFEFVVGLKHYLQTDLDIQVVFYEPMKLNMPFLRDEEILTYITYDYGLWMRSIFSEELGKDYVIPYPSLQVLIPEVLPDKDTLDTFTSDEKQLMGKQSVFDIMKLYWAPIMGLVYYPIQLMSIIDLTLVDKLMEAKEQDLKNPVSS